MTDLQPIPVAVVGVGRMGRHHARVYHELPQAQLLAVVDGDAERAGTVADKHGCDALPSIEALLEKYPQVRAVTIAVPTEHHEAAAMPLLERGIACLIEKPMAASVEVARRIVETAEAHKALVQVGHSERFNPVVRALAELDITPRFIEIDRVSPMQFRSVDVGVVFDLMIHDLDIVLMLTRDHLTDVRATGVPVLGAHEDVANARLEFSGGCVANLTASRLALKTERRLRLFSERAYVSVNYATKEGVAITVQDNVDELARVRAQLAAGKDLSDVDYTELVNIQPLNISDEEPLKAEQANFLNAVAGLGRPAVDARAGYAAVDAAERVVASIRAHKWAGVDTTQPI